MVTGKQYADEALKIYNTKPQPGYIWGTSGETWTAEKQQNLVKKYNSNPEKYSDLMMAAEYGSKWIGHTVYDCSGLTSKCGKNLGLKFYHGSNSSWNKDCQKKGKKVKGQKIPIGAWMYTGSENNHPHIGIVVDDEYVVEAQGTKAGVTKTKITASKWTYWGLAKGIAFDTVADEPAKKETKPIKVSYPTLRRGAKGEFVVQLQDLLSKDGSSLAIDGIFGPGTQSAVRAFQRKHGLVVDGIVGPKTWAELLKTI